VHKSLKRNQGNYFRYRCKTCTTMCATVQRCRNG